MQNNKVKMPDWYYRRKYPLYGLFRKYFHGNWMTNAILFVTVVAYLVEVLLSGSFNINGQVLEQLGARWNPDIIAGEWWRLFTPIFLHVTIYHIAFNMAALMYAGTIVEEVYGHFKFLLIYLFSGFSGNLISAFFKPNTISAGASTSLFGLFAVIALLQVVSGFKHQFTELSKGAVVLIVANLVFNLFMPSVDIAGHLGGLVGGAISVLFWSPKSIRWHAFHDILGTLVALALVLVAVWYLLNSI